MKRRRSSFCRLVLPLVIADFVSPAAFGGLVVPSSCVARRPTHHRLGHGRPRTCWFSGVGQDTHTTQSTSSTTTAAAAAGGQLRSPQEETNKAASDTVPLPHHATPWQEAGPNLIVTAAGVALTSWALTQALYYSEWMQITRYMWTLAVGVLYAYGGWCDYQRVTLRSTITHVCKPDDGAWSPSGVTGGAQEATTTTIATTDSDSWATEHCSLPATTTWQSVSCGQAGLALCVGGAADAFLPVYVTGPNLVTAAGLGPDAAAYLFLVTAFSPRMFPPQPTVSRIALLSHLYVLGAGSFEDVIHQSYEVAARVALSLLSYNNT